MKTNIRANIEQQLAGFSPYCSGNVLAAVIAVKGRPGIAEQAGEPVFNGMDGLALDKAFGSLGWGFGSQDTRVWFGLLLAPPGQAALKAQQLRLICEIVDPLVIAALDETARTSLIEAFAPIKAGSPPKAIAAPKAMVTPRACTPPKAIAAAKADAAPKPGVSLKAGIPADFRIGTETYVMGRRLVSVDGFEDALADEMSKQRVWAQLKRCRAPQAQSS